jgi:hypothetical protein
MATSSRRTLSKLPSRIACSVINPNQRSPSHKFGVCTKYASGLLHCVTEDRGPAEWGHNRAAAMPALASTISKTAVRQE